MLWSFIKNSMYQARLFKPLSAESEHISIALLRCELWYKSKWLQTYWNHMFCWPQRHFAKGYFSLILRGLTEGCFIHGFIYIKGLTTYMTVFEYTYLYLYSLTMPQYVWVFVFDTAIWCFYRHRCHLYLLWGMCVTLHIHQPWHYPLVQG